MNQSRIGSLIEAIVNVLIGFGINFVANLFVLPLFGFNVTPGDAFSIGVVFTAISIAAVAELSRKGNDQHNPGKPLHWDRSKSGDEQDAMMRHLLDDAAGVPVDTDGVLHKTKTAWRAMADLQKTLEAAREPK